MKKMIILGVLASLFSINSSYAQIKNAQTATVKISGNCGMCETTIEKAADDNKVSKADWNKDTKMATITYDSKKTDLNSVLKKIALAGYDNEQFLAPEGSYSKLPGCCKYERMLKTEMIMTSKNDTMSKNMTDMHAGHNQDMHAGHNQEEMAKMNNEKKEATENINQEKDQMAIVFDNYFAVKDALVKTDANLAAASAGKLQSAINNIKMDKLAMNIHMEWMKQLEGLKQATEKIKSSTDIVAQRKSFMGLSENMYAMMKIANPEEAVYYQNCPMANGGKGANWLSKESAVKNPYYGSKMMTCGSTVETIK
jgi:copper chaperone CopZ